ncbi:hypothetical protein, partial [Anaplasma bovis]|uniref:hypothetical protein n=1 Tax=Anaplasma bovis TaxID=186733 RepID=UPI002FF2DC99
KDLRLLERFHNEESCRREAVVCLLEEGDSPFIENFTGHDTEHGAKFLKECGQYLLRDPKRLVKILSDGENFISHRYLTQNWKRYFTDEKSVETFFGCALAAGNIQLTRELLNITDKIEDFWNCNTSPQQVVKTALRYRDKSQDVLSNVLWRYMTGYELDTRCIADLVDRDISAGLLEHIFLNCSPETEEAVRKKMAEKGKDGVSIAEHLYDSYDAKGEEVFLSRVCRDPAGGPSHDNSYGKSALKKEMADLCLKYAKNGNEKKIYGLISAFPSILYISDPVTQKSLVEIASDHGHKRTVQKLIDLHEEVMTGHDTILFDPISSIEQVAVASPRYAAKITEAHIQSGGRLERVDAERILEKSAIQDRKLLADVFEKLHPGISKYLSPTLSAQKQDSVLGKYLKVSEEKGPKLSSAEKSTEQFGEYGLLRSHIANIKGSVSSPGRFKREVLSLFNTKKSFTKTALENGKGHSIFTLVALFGTPEQMDMLTAEYRKKSVLSGKIAIDNISTVGSPLQVALQAKNYSMAKHLVDTASKKEICTPRGDSKDNLLHTIIRSSSLDFLHSLPHTEHDSKLVREALMQKNADQVTPLDVALSLGEQHVSALLAFAGSTLSHNDIEIVAASSDIVDSALKSGSAPLLAWLFDAAHRYNLRNEESGNTKRVDILGNEGHERYLIREACKHYNPDLMRLLARKVLSRIEKKVEANLRNGNDQAVIEVDEITKGVSAKVKDLLYKLADEGTYNKELYESLMDLANLSNESHGFFVKCAFEYDNVGFISHIPPREVIEHLEEQNRSNYSILLEGKDNLLSYIIENSSADEISRFDKGFVHALIASRGMPRAKSAYNTGIAGMPAVLGSQDLYIAIASRNLGNVKEILSRNPSLIATPHNNSDSPGSRMLPYEFAVATFREKSERSEELKKYLASETLNFALNEEERRVSQEHDANADRSNSYHSAENPNANRPLSPEDQAKFSSAVIRSLVDFGSDLGIGTTKIDALQKHMAAVAGRLFDDGPDGRSSILRSSLRKRENSLVTERLLENYSRFLLDKTISEAEGRRSHETSLSSGGSAGDLYEEDVYNLSDTVNKKVDGVTLLHLAAMNGSHKVLEELMMLGGDPSITTKNGENVAHLCASSGMRHPEGGYVFDKLVSENPVLNTLDKDGKGMLAHAARCPDPIRTSEMLELIVRDNPALDTKLEKISHKKRAAYVKKELASANASRKDLIINDFIDRNVLPNTGKSSALEAIRKGITKKGRDADKLSDTLVHESAKSFREINPLEVSPTIVSRAKNDLLDQQSYLFDLLASENEIPAARLSEVNSIPMNAFTFYRSDGERIYSPIDHALGTKNAGFVKYLLEQRFDELCPNITNSEGDNLPVRIGKMMINNGSLSNDEKFVELYKSLLERCGCTTQSVSGTTVQTVLGELKGVNGEMLRSVAAFAADKECELKQEFDTELRRMQEGFSDHVVQRLSTMSRTDTGYMRNSTNPFRSLFSMILRDQASLRGGITRDHRAYIEAFLRDESLRNLLRNVDHQGNNPLQSAIQDLTSRLQSEEIGVQRSNLLQEICVDIVEQLDREDPALLEDVFLKHKNCQGYNFIETLVGVTPSYELFRILETKLTKKSISEHSDLNTVLAKSSGQSAMQHHICEGYSVFSIGDKDAHGESRVHNATVSGNHDAFLSVMSTGGNINQLDDNGNTPLHSLLINLIQNKENIRGGHIKTIETLVTHGAPLHHRNNDGFTVCDIAKTLTGPVFGKKKSCLELVADSRLRYHSLREKLKEEVEKKFVTGKGKKTNLQHCDISGSRLSLEVSPGSTLSVSKLLLCDMCSSNSLSSANMSFNDGKDQGIVEKVGKKRNYVPTKGVIKLDLAWRPKNGGGLQKVAVEVKDDGTICVHPDSLNSCGDKGENLNFNNCQVYVGGYPLAEALRMGRWRSATQEVDSPDLSPDRDQQHNMSQNDPSLDPDVPPLDERLTTPKTFSMTESIDPEGRNSPSPVDAGLEILRTAAGTSIEEHLLGPLQEFNAPGRPQTSSRDAAAGPAGGDSPSPIGAGLEILRTAAGTSIEERLLGPLQELNAPGRPQTSSRDAAVGPAGRNSPSPLGARIEILRTTTSTSIEEHLLAPLQELNAPGRSQTSSKDAAVGPEEQASTKTLLYIVPENTSEKSVQTHVRKATKLKLASPTGRAKLPEGSSKSIAATIANDPLLTSTPVDASVQHAGPMQGFNEQATQAAITIPAAVQTENPSVNEGGTSSKKKRRSASPPNEHGTDTHPHNGAGGSPQQSNRSTQASIVRDPSPVQTLGETERGTEPSNSHVPPTAKTTTRSVAAQSDDPSVSGGKTSSRKRSRSASSSGTESDTQTPRGKRRNKRTSNKSSKSARPIQATVTHDLSKVNASTNTIENTMKPNHNNPHVPTVHAAVTIPAAMQTVSPSVDGGKTPLRRRPRSASSPEALGAMKATITRDLSKVAASTNTVENIVNPKHSPEAPVVKAAVSVPAAMKEKGRMKRSASSPGALGPIKATVTRDLSKVAASTNTVENIVNPKHSPEAPVVKAAVTV